MAHSFRQLEGHGLSHRVAEWKRDASEGAPTHLILLLHGYMDAALTWDRVAPALAANGALVVAPDLRGYGEGARAPDGSAYHFPDYVFDVADLLEQYDTSLPLLVVGHSMGGTAATLYGATFPERVRALALLEGLGPPDNPLDVAPVRLRGWIEQTRRVRASKQKATRAMSPEMALARLRENHPTVDEAVLRDRLQHLSVPIEGGVRWAYDPMHKPISPTPFQAPLFAEFIKKVACPVLFVSGGPTGYHPPDEEDRLALFAHLERAEITDAGHMMHWTRPAELADILLAFVRQNVTAAKPTTKENT